MKNVLVTSLLFLAGCCNSCNEPEACGDNCSNCAHTQPSAMTNNPNDSSVFQCKLTTPELRRRKAEVIDVLRGQVQEKKELPNGYAYRFSAEDNTLDTLMSFIKAERSCCSFFGFALRIEGDISWLDITGPAGVKEFIQTELEM